MPRAPRSQPTQSQPAPTQTQRGKRRADDDDDEDGYGGDGGGHGDGDAEMGNDEIDRKANDLVRLALFAEQRRVPLKRDEINKKAMGTNTKAFNTVLALAQKTLRDTFGMDLVELHRAAEEAEPEPTQGGVKKRAAASGTKSYILRSTLHSTIIDLASQTDARILEEESADIPDIADDDEEGWPRPFGSIIAWSGSDHLGSLGILHVVLALVMVSGRVMNDGDLRAQLRRLRLDFGAQVPVGPQATHRTLTIENFLSQAQRAGYLEQNRVGADGAAKKGGKRGRVAADGGDDNVQYEWSWGPRAHAEIGEQGIARFISEFMAEQYAKEEEEEEDSDGEEAGRARGAVNQGKIATVLRGVETATGGALADVR